MSPDLQFASILIVRMVVTAAFVLAATVTAERAGPLIGGLVATLPLGGGPVYVFLALDHDAQFIAASALNSLTINAVNVIFALLYARLAQARSLPVSLLLALLVWTALAWLAYSLVWTLPMAVLFNVVAIGACLVLAWPLRGVPMPLLHRRWFDLVLRAAMVAALVGVTVTASFRIGPSGSGILAAFPIILISVILILHPRVGGKPTAAVMANAVIGLVGFASACLVLHITAEPLGSAIALSLALTTSIAWSLLVLLARRSGILA
jgi:hypothetical protein